MEISIKNKELIKAVEDLANEQGKNVDEVAEEMLTYSVNNGIAVLLMQRIEYAIVDQIIPKLDATLANTFAARHQIANLHADISQSPDRAEAINMQASEIAQNLVFGEDK